MQVEALRGVCVLRRWLLREAVNEPLLQVGARADGGAYGACDPLK